MADAVKEPVQSLSSWWRAAAIVTMAAGFAVLILLTVKAYQSAPPIPDKFVDPAGAVVFTADDVIVGQQVFLKHGLMDNGFRAELLWRRLRGRRYRRAVLCSRAPAPARDFLPGRCFAIGRHAGRRLATCCLL